MTPARPYALLALFLCALVAPAIRAQVPSPGGEPSVRASIATPDAWALHESLHALGYDCGHGVLNAEEVELFASPAELAALAQAGLQPQVLQVAAPLASPEGVPSGYRDFATVHATLTALEATYPTLARVVDIAQTYGPGATHEGRPIPAIVISDDVQNPEDEPAVLIASCHHCREIVTPELALEIAAKLLSEYATDPQIQALVDAQEIWIVPVVNPDGLEYVWNVNNLWRKNRKPAGSAIGIDLNRNYPLGWDASCGGSTNPGSSVYRGPSPASEEETQSILGLSAAKRFAKVLDFHSSGREVLQGYDCTPYPAVLDGWIDAEAVRLSGFANYGVRNPSADGEHQQQQIAELTNCAFLVETATSFQPPHADALLEFARVWPLVREFLAREPAVRGHVTDAQTGLPVEASITITGITWTNGERRRSEPLNGRYQLFLPDGTFELTFSAPGYTPAVQTVQVGGGVPALLPVALQPDQSFRLVATSTPSSLSLSLVNIPPASGEGLLLTSFATQLSAGSGPLGGLVPDALTFAIVAAPAQAGSLFRWTWPVSAPLFPAAPFTTPLPLGGLPSGTQVDFLPVALGPGSTAVVEVGALVRATL